jgi:hypothetical protein
MSKNFYCKNICGDPDFSIEQWHEQMLNCLKAGIKMPSDVKCTEQCFDCMAIVGERQKQTKELPGNN